VTLLKEIIMTRIFAIAVVALGVSACTSTERTAVTGAAIGAGAGALINGGKGAVAGALIGGVAGTLIGKAKDGRCIYRDSNTGRTYRASC
jgi:hypothetical protein